MVRLCDQLYSYHGNFSDNINQRKWVAPQLSPTSQKCIRCLTVLGRYLGWKWISDGLIREQLWPLLQKWSRKTMGEEVAEAVIVAITQLIGMDILTTYSTLQSILSQVQ